MSYIKVQKIRKRKKIVGLLVVILALYLFLKPIINIISGGLKTTLPSKETLVESIKGEGFFIRSEKVIKSDINGILKKTVDEGSRVGAGIEVASIHSLKDSSSLEREIVEIEQAIISLEKAESKVDLLENEKDNLEDLRLCKIEQIQRNIINKDYKDINITKRELVSYEQKQNDVNFSGNLASESIESLKSRKDKIMEEINTNNIKYYTQNAGMISYKVDNYEDIYIPRDFEKYTYEKLNSDDYIKQNNTKGHSEEVDMEVSVGQTIYKLLDDFEWYLAIKLDNLKDTTDLDLNKAVNVKIDGEDLQIKGNIVNINKSNNTAVVVIKFNTMMYKFYNNRVSMVELIKSKINAFKIPNESIIKNNGQDGVYIKNKGGIVEFKPVFKIKEIGEYAYIQTGDNSSNVYLKKDSKPLKTINMFDEIILNTKNIRVGDIVN